MIGLSGIHELNEGFSGFGKSWPRLTSESGKTFGSRTDFVGGLMFSAVRFCSGYGGCFFFFGSDLVVAI